MIILLYKSQLQLQQSIRRLIIVMIAGLVFSGLTAFPIESQLTLAHQWMIDFKADGILHVPWIEKVYRGVYDTNAKYPFMAYGTDWLAFAHLMIAIAFIGPLKDPVRNIWIIEFGMIACVAIFPLAFIAGAIRGIPLYWRFIDCSFGFFGGLILWTCYRKIKALEQLLKDLSR